MCLVLPRTKTTVAIASAPQVFNPSTANPTPSVITRLLQPQPQQRGSFGGGKKLFRVVKLLFLKFII